MPYPEKDGKRAGTGSGNWSGAGELEPGMEINDGASVA